jgi:hypothetical protein
MPWGVAAAAVVGAYSADKQSKAAKSAANAQSQSADQEAQVQRDMFNQSRADNEPFRQAGLTGLQEYMALLGLPTSSVSSSAIDWTTGTDVPSMNGALYSSDPRYKYAWDRAVAEHGKPYTSGSDRDVIESRLQQLYNSQPAPAGATSGTSLTQQHAFDRFRNQPGYQFGFNEGQRAIESSASASGGLFSGKAGKALARYGTDYADQQGFTPYMNRLASLAGIGQTATSQNNQLGMQTAGNIGNALQNAGNARASGIAGSANAWGNYASGLGGLAGAYAGGMFSGGSGSSAPGWWGRGGWGGI